MVLNDNNNDIRNNRKNYKNYSVWRKIREYRTFIVMIFVIVLMIGFVIAVLNVNWIMEYDEGDVNIDVPYPSKSFLADITSETNDTEQIENLEYNYYKTNTSNFQFIEDWDNLINFTVGISFTTNISIDSNLYTAESVGMWNFNDSQYDFNGDTITGNYTKSITYTSNEYLNKTFHTNTSIQVIIQTSNIGDDYSFDLNINASGYFSGEQITYAVLYNSSFDYQTLIDSETIKGYWKFDEVSGTNATDSSGSEHHGTTQNMEDADWVDGKLGGALVFDGTNELVDADNWTVFENDDEYSLEVWVNTTKSTGTQGIIGKYDQSETEGWFLYLDGLKVSFLRQQAPTSFFFVQASYQLTPNTWHHIVHTSRGYTAPENLIYIDGVERKDTGIGFGSPFDFQAPLVNLTFGYTEQAGYFEGELDNIWLFSAELSQDDVDYQYNGGAGRTWTPPYTQEFIKTNTSYHRFEKDWNNLKNFTVNVDFQTNISITSNYYLNESFQMFNFTSSNWVNVSTDTIEGNYTNSFTFTSKDYLNQTYTNETNIVFRVRASNVANDFLFDLDVDVSGYFYPLFYFTNGSYSGTTLNMSSYLHDWDMNYLKNRTYFCKFDAYWKKMHYVVFWINTTLNATISSSEYLNVSIQLWNVANQTWDSIDDITITGNHTIYFERYGREYLTKDVKHETELKFQILTSNLPDDYTISISLTVLGWKYHHRY
jgi:hypothetical protein